MPIRICLEPTCPNPATTRGRCPTHATQRNRETRSPNHKLYATKRWQMTRRKVLNDQPLCERCEEEIATDVHHRVDLAAGGNPWALNGLEALCHACHSQETRRRQTA